MNGLFQKKNNIQVGWEHRVPVVLKMWTFQGLRKGIYMGDQEKIIWNFQESWIWALGFTRGITQFLEILEVKLHFLWNFLG